MQNSNAMNGGAKTKRKVTAKTNPYMHWVNNGARSKLVKQNPTLAHDVKKLGKALGKEWAIHKKTHGGAKKTTKKR